MTGHNTGGGCLLMLAKNMLDMDQANKAKSRYDDLVYQTVNEVHCLDKELLASLKIEKKQHKMNTTKMQYIEVDERDRNTFKNVLLIVLGYRDRCPRLC